MTIKLPSARDLNYQQYSGWACCFCGKALWRGAVSVGIAVGSQGACVLDVEVFACSLCARCFEQDDEEGDDQ